MTDDVYDRHENREAWTAWQCIMKTDVNLFLTGNAGTGKTTFLKRLRERCHKRMVVVAPTGVAAINAGGMTIHSFFQISPGLFLPNRHARESFNMRKNKLALIRSLNLLVIDEVSMVRADLLDAIDDRLRRIRRSSMPFGGVQLLLIGDLRQLSPVVSDEEVELLRPYYSTNYFFGSKALQQTQFQTIELKKIYRQTDVEFVSLLNKVRTNDVSAEDLQRLNSRYKNNFIPPRDTHYVKLTTHNANAEKINNLEMAMLSGRATTFRAKIENKFTESSAPAEKELTLKEGARVMFIKNDSQTPRRFYNGKMARVKEIGKNSVTVVCDDDNLEVEVSPATWQSIRYEIDKKTGEMEEIVEGTFTQIPLRLAWAITIHKSQGLTFDRAIIDASNAFSSGQVYVALSRCRSFEGLVLSSPIPAQSIMSDLSVDNFLDVQERNAMSEETLEHCKEMYEYRVADSLLDFHLVYGAAYRVIRVIDEHYVQTYDKWLQESKCLLGAATQEVDEVSRRFRSICTQRQMSGMAMDDKLRQRIVRGCKYFLQKLSSTYEAIERKADMDVGNKAIKEQYDEMRSQLSEALSEKRAELRAVAEAEQYTIDLVLEARANFFASEGKSDKETAKKETKPKAQKGDSAKESVEMFKQLGSVDAVAETRNLKKATILTHLLEGLPDNGLSIDSIMGIGRYRKLRKKLAGASEEDLKYGSDFMKSIIGEKFYYAEVKYVINELKAERE